MFQALSIVMFINASSLSSLAQTAKNVKVLDCTFETSNKSIDYKQWQTENYGKFEKLIERDSNSKQEYFQSHIPGAIYFDLGAAMYPSRFERYAHYEPDIFENYIQFLGINQTDEIIIYGRGKLGGMLFASKCLVLFQIYGHQNVKILDGGFDEWKKSGYQVENNTMTIVVGKGNWKAVNYKHKLITFEEMMEKDRNGKDIFERSSEFNILDGRPKEQYSDRQKARFNMTVVKGSFIPGIKNFPTPELVGKNGKLLSISEIKQKLQKLNFDPQKLTITLCNSGFQASFIANAIKTAYPETSIRIFSGSMKEMELRAPEKITGIL